MTRLARPLLVALATLVTMAWLSTTEAFARVAPPDIGPLPPAPQVQAGNLVIDKATWIVVGVVLGAAITALAVAVYSIARNHQQNTRPVAVS